MKVFSFGCLIKRYKHSLNIQGMFTDDPQIVGYARPPAMDAEKESNGAWSNKEDGEITGLMTGTWERLKFGYAGWRA